jgi:hypothetical protein
MDALGLFVASKRLHLTATDRRTDVGQAEAGVHHTGQRKK